MRGPVVKPGTTSTEARASPVPEYAVRAAFPSRGSDSIRAGIESSDRSSAGSGTNSAGGARTRAMRAAAARSCSSQSRMAVAALRRAPSNSGPEREFTERIVDSLRNLGVAPAVHGVPRVRHAGRTIDCATSPANAPVRRARSAAAQAAARECAVESDPLAASANGSIHEPSTVENAWPTSPKRSRTWASPTALSTGGEQAPACAARRRRASDGPKPCPYPAQPVLDDVVDHRRLGQRRRIAEVVDLVRGHLAQDAAHDLARPGLRQSRRELG